jgi:3-oxoacyl-[acyl-carrier-protein] synthase-3
VLRIKVVGTGVFAPERVETAEELAPRIGRSPEWIRSRTGVGERRIAAEPLEEMAARAARQALGDGPRPDLIINTSTTPLQLIPDTSVFIQHALGFEGIPSFSIHATCLSFLVGLHNAAALIHAGAYRRVLLVSAERGTPFRDPGEPESAALLGDGAGAAVVEATPPGEPSGLADFRMATWPAGREMAEFRGCGIRTSPLERPVDLSDYHFRMKGTRIYRLARSRISDLLFPMVADAGLTPATVDWVVPHQMSGRGVAAFVQTGFREERVINIIGEYGNCIAASLPMALHAMAQRPELRRGDSVVLAGTGAGVSVASALLRW